MSLSRRKFIKAGAVTAAVFAFPLKSVIAQTEQSSSSGVEQLSYYTMSAFTPYLNTEFRLYLDTSNTLRLKLVEVSDYLSSLSRRLTRGFSPDNECFSLLLTIPGGQSFEQNTYLMEHDALGSFYLFLVPVSPQGRRPLYYYEAIVYRREGTIRGYEAAFIPGANGRRGKKDVFYFRPEEIAPPPAPVSDPGAPGRMAAARLTLGQSPSIAGLRLGMTTRQVLALFPGIADDPEIRSSLSRPASKFGVSGLTITPGRYPSAKAFDQVTQINLAFLDGRVFTLNVGYKGPVWSHVDEFVARFSAETGLPGPASWDAYVGMDTQLKTLRGADFDVSLFAGGNNVNINYAQLRDLTARQKLTERQAKARGTT